jgi:hypothetical protein
VDDFTVPTACLLSNGGAALKKNDALAGASETPGNGETDGSSTDDCYIEVW